MLDLIALAEAVAGIRQDREAAARVAHRLEYSSGLLLVHGSDTDRVVDPGQLAYVEAGDGGVHFVLLDGSRVEGNSTYTLAGVLEALADYPQVLQVQDDYLVNLNHVRAIGRPPGGQAGRLLYLAGGLGYLSLAAPYMDAVQAFFQLPTLAHVVPWNERYQALLDENIRTYDDDIHTMDAARLHLEFRYMTIDKVDERQLMCNLIWQYRTWLARPEGDPKRKELVDGNLRTFWYYLKPVLSRLGPLNPDRQYEMMLDVFNKLVGKDHLFHYRDFGFVDENAAMRQLGKTYPHIILAAEKEGHYTRLQKLQEEFGFTIIALGGQPSMLAAEFLCTDLAAVVDLDHIPLRLIALVDYDPSGNIIITAFEGFLESFGVKQHTRGSVVLPSRFPPEELPNVTYQLPLNTPGDRTKAKRWVEEFGGGIDGQYLGIESEALIFDGLLHPVVVELFEEAKKPAPLRLEQARASLARWGLPETFSAELLAEDEAGFWERWAEKQASR